MVGPLCSAYFYTPPQIDEMSEHQFGCQEILATLNHSFSEEINQVIVRGDMW